MTARSSRSRTAWFLFLFAVGSYVAAHATGRTGGPGGSNLDQWLEVFFDNGSNTNGSAVGGTIELLNPSNGVQRAVGITVGAICPELNQVAGATLTPGQLDLRDRCNEIVDDLVDNETNDPPTQANALQGLQEMGAEENSAIRASEVDMSQAHEGHVGNRMANLRAGLGGATVAFQGRHFDAGGLVGGNAGSAMRRWSFFVDASIGRADKDATSLESGFDADSATVTAGIDYALDHDLISGLAFGYTKLDADLDDDGGKLETNSRSLLIYTTWYAANDWYMDGMLGYTANGHDQERNIRYTISTLGGGGITRVNNTADSSNDSDEWSFSLQLGRDFRAARWTLSPYGRFAYATTHIDGYREDMTRPAQAGGGLAVAIDSQNHESKTLALGTQAQTDYHAGGAILVPHLTAEYVHEFDNDNKDITGRFVNALSDTEFSIPTDGPDRDYFNVGAGLAAFLQDDIQLFLQYQAQLGYRDLHLYDVKAGMKMSF